jgi:transposase
MDLTNEQWEVLEPLILDPVRQADGRGRPWRDSRDVLNGILWVLRTGAPWRDLPETLPALPDVSPTLPAVERGRCAGYRPLILRQVTMHHTCTRTRRSRT